VCVCVYVKTYNVTIYYLLVTVDLTNICAIMYVCVKPYIAFIKMYRLS